MQQQYKLILGAFAFLALGVGGAWLYKNRTRQDIGEFAPRLDMKSAQAPGRKVSLAISAPPQCAMGDWDAMAINTYWVPDAPILVTLERLDARKSKGKAVKPVALIKTDLEAIKGGFAQDVKLPRTSELESYGLFVCIDAKGEGSCLNKESKTYSELLAGNSAAEQNAPNAKPVNVDRIFFFHALLSDGNEVKAVPPRAQERNEQQWAKDIAQLFRALGDDKLGSWVRDLNKISSLPVELAAGKIAMKLPRQYLSACGISAPAPANK